MSVEFEFFGETKPICERIGMFQDVSLGKCRRATVTTDSVSAVSVIRGLPRPEKKGKLKKYTIHKFQNTRPVLDSSSLVPVLTLPGRTYLHSSSSLLAVRISCHVIAVFVFRKPVFIN
jgi:hypothetical protein